MLYIIYQEDRDEGAAEIRARVKPDHLAYLARFEDQLVLGGAMLAEDGVRRTGSVLILNVPGYAEAEAFSLNEPFRKAGLFKSVRISRMRRGQWNPAAAPASAEGN
ncbi:YciI-like protein [Pigmentiphaga humi]|uniref:YciI-like protein n=1 Tax=Pigmentiphaga humi TaxID=2478468 RepID=A0A3P4AZN7_9BURK|nr:YciI family protein [Pigmentiphaga humi]VCU69527.1 YciI-like protein [Pigmentiphaga humi]